MNMHSLKTVKDFVNNKKIRPLFIVFTTAIIAVLFYFLNYYTPFYGDDYVYSFSFKTGEPITSFGQIIGSQVTHYQILNGRSIVHIIAQLFLMLGDNTFNFINTFFFIALLYVVYLHSCGTFKNFSLSKFVVITSLIFLSTPAFGQSFLWLTGSSNYLYGIFIILCFMIPFRLQLENSLSVKSAFFEAIYAIGMLLVGIIAGWTNENTSVAMIAMIIGYIFVFVVHKIKIRAWHITGLIGGIIGCIIMLTAPGNAVRLNKIGATDSVFSWIKKCMFYTCDTFVYLSLPILIFTILIMGYAIKKIDTLKKEGMLNSLISIFKECDTSLIYLLGFLGSVYSMIVVPSFPERVWSGPILFFIIALINFSSLINFKVKIEKKVLICFLVILSLTTYVNAFFELKNVNSLYEKRVAEIETAVASGQKEIELESISGSSGFSCYHNDLSYDYTAFPNYAIANYYGLDKVLRK